MAVYLWNQILQIRFLQTVKSNQRGKIEFICDNIYCQGFFYSLQYFPILMMFQPSIASGCQQPTYYLIALHQLQALLSSAQSENQIKIQNLQARIEAQSQEINCLKMAVQLNAEFLEKNMANLNEKVQAILQVNQEKPKRKFKKTTYCQIDDCGRRYSSKIALNYHIRNKHGLQDSSDL